MGSSCCREVTDDGDIVGSFTDQGDATRPAKVYFFRIPARESENGTTNKQGHAKRIEPFD